MTPAELKSMRKLTGLTQEKFAAMSGLSRYKISVYESGLRSIPEIAAYKILAVDWPSDSGAQIRRNAIALFKIAIGRAKLNGINSNDMKHLVEELFNN